MTKNIELFKGDCLVEMKSIPAGSVNLVLTDPPYGTTACKWDSVIPLDLMWAEIRRVLAPDGTVVLHGCQPFTSVLVASNLAWFKYDWIWRKPKGTGHLNAKKMPMRDKEDILVFAPKQAVYNPQFSAGEAYKARPGKSKANGEDCYGEYKDVREDNDGRRYPKQVIEFGAVERNKLHPTQKPVDLLEYLVRTHSNDGGVVLDFTMGSGSTGVACLNTNRKFIGIERDEIHFATAEERLTKHAEAVSGED